MAEMRFQTWFIVPIRSGSYISEMNKLIRISMGLIAISLMIALTSCYSQNEGQMKIEWSKLSTHGLDNNLAKGVSASYSAIIDGKLIVAGGANFPDKLGFEGGSKALYDEILLYDVDSENWIQIGTLPQKSAYGVSINSADGAYWIGGNSDSTSLNSAYHVRLVENKIELEPITSLPVSMDNFAGCEINNKLFVAGGNADGKQSNSIYTLDLKGEGGWTKLSDFPGMARVQPVISALEIDGKEYLYLLGGFFLGDSNNKPTMATDVLRYDVEAELWEIVGSQIDENSEPFSLGGATAMAYDDRYVVCFGGVNYNVFLDAISTQYEIGINDEMSAEEKATKNLEFSKHYMTQPIEYYKFNQEVRVFDTHTSLWTTIDVTENSARAGATLVYDEECVYLVQGELKPGVRSPQTWRCILGFE